MKKNTLVRFNFDGMPEAYAREYPFTVKDRFIYLGDVVQMPGHCVVVRIEDGQMFCCYHTDDFVKVPKKEC
jgi:hypothetical protein